MIESFGVSEKSSQANVHEKQFNEQNHLHVMAERTFVIVRLYCDGFCYELKCFQFVWITVLENNSPCGTMYSTKYHVYTICPIYIPAMCTL